jgi:hypothetical protein
VLLASPRTVCLRAAFAYANIVCQKTLHALVAASAELALRATSRVTGKLGYLRKTGAEAFQELRMEGIPRFSQRVVVPRSLFAHSDEASSAQIPQMTRRCWLGHVKNRDQVAHAQFALLEQVQDAQSRPVGKCTKQSVDGETGGLQHPLKV